MLDKTYEKSLKAKKKNIEARTKNRFGIEHNNMPLQFISVLTNKLSSTNKFNSIKYCMSKFYQIHYSNPSVCFSLIATQVPAY